MSVADQMLLYLIILAVLLPIYAIPEIIVAVASKPLRERSRPIRWTILTCRVMTAIMILGFVSFAAWSIYNHGFGYGELFAP